MRGSPAATSKCVSGIEMENTMAWTDLFVSDMFVVQVNDKRNAVQITGKGAVDYSPDSEYALDLIQIVETSDVDVDREFINAEICDMIGATYTSPKGTEDHGHDQR